MRSVLWGSRGPVELKQSEGGEHASEMRSGAGGGGGGVKSNHTCGFDTLRLAFTLRGEAIEGFQQR